MKKNVLITGGAGFLGSYLCDYFIEKEYRVICMDNLITGEKRNIKHLDKNPNFLFIQHDVSKKITFPENIDYIMHFASPASPSYFHIMPIEIIKANSFGTFNMLELAKEKGSIFLFASTSECYGDPEINPQTEMYNGNVNTVGVRSCYDESKRFAESLTMAYNRIHSVDVRIARIFNTYGPRMKKNDGRVVPTFINQALENKPITVFGDGSQTRSFCYVDDEIEGFYKLLMSNEIYPTNIGNPDEVNIIDFANEVINVMGSKSEIIFKPLPEHDPKVRRPDIMKAKNVLGWEPKIDLKQGLEKTIGYFKELK